MHHSWVNRGSREQPASKQQSALQLSRTALHDGVLYAQSSRQVCLDHVRKSKDRSG